MAVSDRVRTMAKRWREVVGQHVPLGRFFGVRRGVAARFLAGDGLELGALHAPLPLPRGARVRYVDRLTTDDLRRQYPELRHLNLVPVDVIDNAERLATVPDGSVDFVIANHVLEHMEDPIGALATWLRVVRPGGVVYAAVPHKAHTFDRDRPCTRLEHLVRDHEEGPAGSRRGHFEEWARLVDRRPAAEAAAHADHLMEIDYSIHFHVWTETEVMELLAHCQRTSPYRFSVELLQRNGHEYIFILHRHPSGAA